MNAIDIAVLIVFALGILRGYYRGFLRSVIQLLSLFVSGLLGMLLGPLLRGAIFSTQWFEALRYYIDGAEYIGNNMELARMPVADLTAAQTQEVLAQNSLPYPLPRLLQQNLVTEAFATQGYHTVTDTITETILRFSLNILCFLIVFLLIRALVAAFVISYDKIVGLPILRHHDALIGAGFGLVEAFFLLFIIATLIPVLLTAIQQMGASNLINVKISTFLQESNLITFFYQSNFLLPMFSGI